MKKIFAGILLVALTMVLATQCQGQQAKFVVAKSIITGQFRLAPTAGTVSGFVYKTGDSVEVPLKYSFKATQGNYDLYPDSVVLLWSAKGTTAGDSVGLLYTAVPGIIGGPGGYLTRYTLDSAKVQENDYHKIADSVWLHKDVLKIVVGQNGGASKSQVKGLGGVQAKVWLLLYYKKPGS